MKQAFARFFEKITTPLWKEDLSTIASRLSTDVERHRLALDKSSIAMNEVFDWHHISRTLAPFAPGFEALVRRREVVPLESVDLKQVEGLFASKEDLSRFSSIDAFAQSAAPLLLQPRAGQTPREHLSELMNHSQVRMTSPFKQAGLGDSLHLHLWDRRVFISNAGGSHHYAAAACLARQHNLAVPLDAPLYVHEIDAKAATQVLRQYEVFSVAKADLEPEHWLQLQDLHVSLVPDQRRFSESDRLWLVIPKGNERAQFLIDEMIRRQAPSLNSALAQHLNEQFGQPAPVAFREKHPRDGMPEQTVEDHEDESDESDAHYGYAPAP